MVVTRAELGYLVGVDLESVGLTALRVVAELEREVGGRVRDADQGVLRAGIVAVVLVVGRVQDHLQAVVPGNRRCRPRDPGERGMVGAALHAEHRY